MLMRMCENKYGAQIYNGCKCNCICTIEYNLEIQREECEFLFLGESIDLRKGKGKAF